MPMWIPRLEGAAGDPLFRQIVQSLSDDVAAGRLLAGALLPPHRALADKLGVARGTIAKAYDEARRFGLVKGRVGHGTRVLEPDQGEGPFTPMLEEAGTVSSPLDPDPAAALQELAVRPDRAGLLAYQPQAGLLRHRRLGAAWAARFGVRAEPERVLPCSGAQHALFLAVAQCVPRGERLLVEEWSYPGLHGIAETLGVRLVPVAVDAYGARPEAIAAACRQQRPKALYVMPTIHNPLGCVAPAERRAEWVALARKHGLQVIEDDAFRLLCERPPAPLAELAPERTFFIASASKAVGPGLRVAFLIAPREVMAPLGRALWATQWMVGVLGLEVLAIWERDGVVDRTLRLKRREAKARQALAKRLLGRVRAHEGALHLWLEGATEDRAARARAAGLSAIPSSAFWMRATRAPPALRVALGGHPTRRELAIALQQLR